MIGIQPRTVARKSSIGGLYVRAGGGLDIQIWQKFHWLIVFHISVWGWLKLCLEESPPVATGLIQPQICWMCQLGRFLRHFLSICSCWLIFGLRQASMKLYNIRVLLNRAICWNFQTDIRNLDIAVSVSSNRLFFYDLFDYFFLLGAKLITIIDVVHFLKKRCLAAFSLRNLIVF